MTTEAYPGEHPSPEGERGPVLDLEAMEWQRIGGKVVGMEDKTLSSREECPGGLWVSLVRAVPGGVFPEHHHPYPQLFYFTQGRGVVELNGRPIRVRAGMVVRMFHGEPHKLINDGDEDLVLVQVSLPLWRPQEG